MLPNNFNETAEIRRAEKELLTAMQAGNITFLESIFSDDYVFLGSDGSMWGKEKALEDFKNPRFSLSRIEISNQRICIHDTCAIVTGTSVVKGGIGQKPLTGEYHFLRAWKKEPDGWKIIAVATIQAEKAVQPSWL
jgi:ketosteroid isomerase-like protein